jgi:glycosyltransferase involved in cell wall biosynthesis
VIPSFGTRSGALQRCIESVLWHERDDTEILVVDDCTPDDSVRELTRALGTSYVRRPVNGGVAAAQNTGIEAARGEFIVFLHSDDELAQGHPWCWDDRSVLEGAICRAGVTWHPRLAKASAEDFLLYRFGVIHISACVFPRRVLITTPFDPALRSWEDWDLFYRLLHKGVPLREVEGFFAVINTGHEDRLSLTPHMAAAMQTLYVKHAAVRSSRRIRGHWECYIGRALIRSGSVGEGRRWIRKSIRTDPLRLRRALRGLGS